MFESSRLVSDIWSVDFDDCAPAKFRTAGENAATAMHLDTKRRESERRIILGVELYIRRLLRGLVGAL